MNKALKDAETREMEKENKELLGAMGRLGQKHTGLAASNVLVLSAPVRNYPLMLLFFIGSRTLQSRLVGQFDTLIKRTGLGKDSRKNSSSGDLYSPLRSSGLARQESRRLMEEM